MMGTMGLSLSIALREQSADVATNGRKSLICGSFGSTKRMRVANRDPHLGARSEIRLPIGLQSTSSTVPGVDHG